jgi:hypothetical protein
MALDRASTHRGFRRTTYPWTLRPTFQRLREHLRHVPVSRSLHYPTKTTRNASSHWLYSTQLEPTDSMKLTTQQKHLLKLISRDKKPDGWTTVSKTLCNLLERMSLDIPELVTFERIDDEGRIKLTEKGESIIAATAYL